MKYVLCILTAIYALLSGFAAAVQMKSAPKKDSPALMLCGGILMLAAVVLQITAHPSEWATALIGGLCISIAAFLNGKRSGNFHASHHVVRFLLTAALVSGFLLL